MIRCSMVVLNNRGDCMYFADFDKAMAGSIINDNRNYLENWLFSEDL